MPWEKVCWDFCDRNAVLYDFTTKIVYLCHGSTWQHCNVRACVFNVFKALLILNGYLYCAQMERAQNSDSKTHVENLNWTSRTHLSRKSLSYIFFGTPCIMHYVVLIRENSIWFWKAIKCLVFPGAFATLNGINCNNFTTLKLGREKEHKNWLIHSIYIAMGQTVSEWIIQFLCSFLNIFRTSHKEYPFPLIASSLFEAPKSWRWTKS